MNAGYEKFWFVIASLALVVGLIRVSSDGRQGWLLIAFGLVSMLVNSLLIFKDKRGD